MADGVQITEGSGKTISTDEAASGHVQRMKLTVSADGGDTHIPATADGLGVLTRPETANGLSIMRSLDIDETEEAVKASAGNLYGYYFGNSASSARYLKFYNATVANVTVGSTTPLLTLYLPGVAAGHVEFSKGITFDTAITVACTTGIADADTGAPGTNEVSVNCFYK